MAVPINIAFTVGTLEPGAQYTPQQFAEAIAEILLGEIQQDTLMPGVSGPTAPSQDKGVWINTNTSPHSIWVWNPSTGSYVQEESQTPVGSIVFWPGTSSVPSNFRNCDGAALNKTGFPACYEALGGVNSPYGQTSSVFNLPNASGRTMIGVKAGWSIGDLVGNESIQLEIGDIPDHIHELGVRVRAGGTGVGAFTTANATENETRETYPAGSGSDKGNPVSIIPPSIAGRWIIRVS